MSLARSVLAGSSWVAGSTAVLAVAQVCQLVVLARILGPTQYGVVAIIMMVLAFVEMLMIAGISNAIIQRQTATDDELSSLHWLNTGLGFVLGALVVITAPLVGSYFSSDASVLPVAVLGLAVPINSQTHVSRAVLERDMRFRSVALAEFIAGVASVLAVIAGSFAFGIVGVSIGLLVGFAVRSATFTLMARPRLRLRRHFRFGETRRFLSFGVLQLLNSLVGFIDQSMATLIVGGHLSTRELGGFNLSYNLSVTVPGRLNPVITRVMFPALSRVQNDHAKFSRSTLNLITLTGLVNTPVMLVMAISAPVLVPFVFGEEWTWSVPLLQMLTIVGFTRSLGNPMGIVLMAKNRQRLGLTISLCKTAVAALALLVGTQTWGVYGAPVALALMGLVTLMINQFLLHHLLDASHPAILLAQSTPFFVALVPAGLGVIAFWLVSPHVPAIVTIILVTIVIGGTYAAIAWFSRVPVVREILRHLRRPAADADPEE